MDRNDAVTLVGVGLLAAGLWMVYPPAALIAVGLALVGMGLMGAWKKALTLPSPQGRGDKER